jgi:hypothetical protein
VSILSSITCYLYFDFVFLLITLFYLDFSDECLFLKTLDCQKGSNKGTPRLTKRRPERGIKPLRGKLTAQISVEGDQGGL